MNYNISYAFLPVLFLASHGFYVAEMETDLISSISYRACKMREKYKFINVRNQHIFSKARRIFLAKSRLSFCNYFCILFLRDKGITSRQVFLLHHLRIFGVKWLSQVKMAECRNKKKHSAKWWILEIIPKSHYSQRCSRQLKYDFQDHTILANPDPSEKMHQVLCLKMPPCI